MLDDVSMRRDSEDAAKASAEVPLCQSDDARELLHREIGMRIRCDVAPQRFDLHLREYGALRKLAALTA